MTGMEWPQGKEVGDILENKLHDALMGYTQGRRGRDESRPPGYGALGLHTGLPMEDEILDRRDGDLRGKSDRDAPEMPGRLQQIMTPKVRTVCNSLV